MNYTKPTDDLESILLKAAAPSEDKKCILLIGLSLVVKQFADFLEKCFMLDPEKRLSPQDALRHPFLAMSS